MSEYLNKSGLQRYTNELWAKIGEKYKPGAPLVANTASDMTDTDRVYVYTGNETGYSTGHWYYYDGSAWTDGGVYNSVAGIDDAVRFGIDQTKTEQEKLRAQKNIGLDTNNGDINAQLAKKADINGSYEGMSVGNAEQLISSIFVEDKEPYSIRPSGGSLEIGNREYDSLVGVSMVQNQLINPDGMESSKTEAGVTFTKGSDGSIRISGTKTSNANTYYVVKYSLPTGHKYVLAGANTDNSDYGGPNGGYNLFCNYAGAGTSFAKQFGKQPMIINPSETSAQSFQIKIQVGNADAEKNTYNETIFPVCINLTQAYGKEFADWLYSLTRVQYTEILFMLIPQLNNGRISHNVGSLESACISKHVMTRFNQYNPATGKATVIRGYQYQITGTYSSLIDVTGDTLTPDEGGYFTPEYTGEITVNGGNTTDTCVHFVRDGSRDGEFEEFGEHEYAIEPVDLPGLLRVDANGNIYADGDTYAPSGAGVQKWKVANLGTAITSWNYEQRGSHGRFGSIQKLEGAATSGGTNIGILCAAYAPNAALISSNNVNMAICLYNGSVYIRDDNYNTPAQIKAALAGVFILYPLATSIEVEHEEYASPQAVDVWGTEAYIDAKVGQDRAIAVPMGHVTKYPQDLKAKLESAPNAPATDGDYILRKTGRKLEYVPLAEVLPEDPTEDGTYNLRMVVTGGVRTLMWVSE